MCYFDYATSVKLKAKVKQSFPDIIGNSMPLDHPDGREQKSAYTRLIWTAQTKTKTRSCLIYFPMDLFPYVDWHKEKAIGQRAAHCAPLFGARVAVLMIECLGKGQGQKSCRPICIQKTTQVMSLYYIQRGVVESTVWGVKRDIQMSPDTRTQGYCILGQVFYFLLATTDAEKKCNF